MSAVKSHGVVYTPEPVANRILDEAGLGSPEALAAASVCDPACGDGAFLVPLAGRILRALPRREARAALRRIVGADRDPKALAACRARLNALLRAHDPRARIPWKLPEKDALEPDALESFPGAFTHIVGNPPYVRVQNLEADGRRRIAGRFRLVRGATDLYLVFFELGLRLLRPGGRLAFITPSSWLRSDSGTPFRAELTHRHRVVRILDYGDHQAFPTVTTYTAITVIERTAFRARLRSPASTAPISSPTASSPRTRRRRERPGSPSRRRSARGCEISGLAGPVSARSRTSMWGCRPSPTRSSSCAVSPPGTDGIPARRRTAPGSFSRPSFAARW